MPDAIAATKFRLHKSEILRKKGEHRYSRYNVCVGGGGGGVAMTGNMRR